MRPQPRSRKPSVIALTSGMPVRAMALIRALTSAMALNGLAASASAYARTSFASDAPATTRCTSPHVWASAAENRRHSMMISFARAGPTRRTKRVVDATPSGTPRSTSGIHSCASAAAQRKSHASVSPQPPPTAWPLIAAIVACSSPSSSVLTRSKSRRNWLLRWPNAARRSSADIPDLSPASAPAENTGGAPVTMTTRVAPSSRSSVNAAARAVSIGSLSELRRSGRFSVTVAIAPSRTSVTFSLMRADGNTRRAPPATAAPRAGGSGEETEGNRCGPEAGEERCGRHAEMARRGLREERAEVGRDREVAALEELVRREPGPASVGAAAPHAAAEDEHGGPVAVIGAAIAVLGHGPAELGHRDHDDVRHLVAEILSEGRQRPAELTEPQRQLAALGTLADVGVPALHVGECDLEADVGLDELSDLPHGLAEGAPRIVGAVRGRDTGGIGAPEHLHGREGLAARPVQQIANPLLVKRLEALPRPRVAVGPDVEPLDGLHRDGTDVALERSRERSADRDSAERTRGLRARPDRARQPAVGRALDPRCAAFHVVLRVEVRARRVGRATRMNDGQRAAPPERHERSERRVQREEAVEVDGALALALLRRLKPDRGPHGGVAGIAVGHHHAEPVHGAALEDRHQHLAARLGGTGRSQQKSRRRRVGDQRASSGLQERASGEEIGRSAHCRPSRGWGPAGRGAATDYPAHRRWNSGEPMTSAASLATSVLAGPRSSADSRVICGSASWAARTARVAGPAWLPTIAARRRSSTSAGERGSLPAISGARSTATCG